MRSVGCVLFLCLALPAAAAAGVPLAQHRAVYDLTLAPGADGVEAARGRIAIEFFGSPCEGWTTRVRQVTALDLGDGGTRTLDSNSATFEEADGTLLRFRSESRADGQPIEAVDGTATRVQGDTRVVIEAPDAETLVVPGTPLFPTQHIARLIGEAGSGASLFAARVFDGTGDGRTLYDTLAVIGPALPAPDSDAEGQEPTDALAGLDRWPVRLSYFEPGPGERTPDYIVGFTLFANGVSSDLSLEFDGFTLKGELSALELVEPQECRL
ncbi:cell envelope integrity EipB family protein [Salinarimonas rosea]|uniref:cell envelope integrity EipB family protein n=1 Tax=Salinarimonas rosea TaxID=552063 RepID=UPI0003F8CF52|nr:cell envelope integrity EipB family protein [Salinarimonas rosea]